MVFSFRALLAPIALLTCSIAANAQETPIGYWRSLLPYNNAVGVANDGRNLYVACSGAFFTLKPGESPVPYSKVEGMSEIGMQCIGYDKLTSTAVLCYTNGNIDLFKDNTFYNVPDIKVKTGLGDRTIYEVNPVNGIAYLSTAQGVVLLNIDRKEIDETYQLMFNNQVVKVRSFVEKGDSFYAATSAGLFVVNKDNPALQNAQTWKRANTTDSLLRLSVVNDVVYAHTATQLFEWNNGNLRLVYTAPPEIKSRITHIDAGSGKLFVSVYSDSVYTGKVLVMGPGQQFIDSFKGEVFSTQVNELADGSVWVADANSGLRVRDRDRTNSYTPYGPAEALAFDIYANDGDLYLAHGGFTDAMLPLNSGKGISHFTDGKWKSYSRYVFNPINDAGDICAFVKDEKTGTLYCASYDIGLFVLNNDESTRIVSSRDTFDYSEVYAFGKASLLGVGLDKKGTLWASTMGTTQHQLYSLTPGEPWRRYAVPGAGYGGALTIDDNGQVWFINTSGTGLTVYNAGELNDAADDSYYHLVKGAGAGNLPSNNVLCLAKDQSNNIWIGTDNGIGIASHCLSPFTQAAPCDVERPIVQYDQFAGYLFDGNAVRTIAVDGANRKWVGTDDGVWLLSSHAEKIIYRFTVDNSPLPSSRVRKISVDKVNGDVYIATDRGVVCFRSTATEGGTTNENVQVFPSPVPRGYSGTIAIKGLVANADVRITDLNGQLVYRTKALGGQAVWDGKDYKGRKPATGVYLVFATNNDGSETFAGKFLFIQ